MTRYTVVWHRDAREDLARLWIDATDRNALTAAAHQIDIALREDADRKGTELSEGLRQLIAGPIRVLFVVREADRLVDVSRTLRSF